MQLQQLLRPLQEGTFRFARTLLNDNPDLLQKYVSTGMSVVGTALVPLNLFMKHLLLIQKIDPNTVPGQKAAKELQAAMDSAFERDHQKEYDEDFDLDWVNKRFEQARKQLRELQLTKEKFLDLTDLSKLPGGFKLGANFGNPSQIDRGYDDPEFFNQTTEVNRIAPVSEKRELPLDKEGRAGLRQKVLREVFDPITDLRNAIKAIEADLGLDKKKPGGLKTAKKKVNKKITKIGKTPRSATVHEKLVRDMIARNLLPATPEDMAAQMTEMAKWDDMTLDSFKKVIDKHIPKKSGNKFKGSFRRAVDP